MRPPEEEGLSGPLPACARASRDGPLPTFCSLALRCRDSWKRCARICWKEAVTSLSRSFRTISTPCRWAISAAVGFLDIRPPLADEDEEDARPELPERCSSAACASRSCWSGTSACARSASIISAHARMKSVTSSSILSRSASLRRPGFEYSGPRLQGSRSGLGAARELQPEAGAKYRSLGDELLGGIDMSLRFDCPFGEGSQPQAGPQANLVGHQDLELVLQRETGYA